MHSRLPGIIASVVLLALSTNARASEPDGPSFEAAPTADPGLVRAPRLIHEPGYRLEMAGLDSAALLLAGAGIWLAESGHEDAGQGFAVTGFLLYSTGGPILHGTHRDASYTLGSIGLRQGLPLLGGLTGYLAAGSCDKSDKRALGDCFLHGVGEFAVGFAIGIPVAMVLDNVFLAGPRDVPVQPDEVQWNAGLMLDPSTGAAGLVIGGVL